ncbi:TPA: hypothetical protein NKS41_000084 [Vibrio parahaemolyticus]|nr:hypothetical protein [Vibrio parahaemolyticus]
MLKKLKLIRADKYAESVTTYYAARAVIAHLEGREHCKRIGNEQGDVPEWDDIVLHDLNGRTIYCQVKRQMTDFCTKKHDDNIITRSVNKGKFQPLSPLDKAFRSLADIFNTATKEVIDKTFYLSTPFPQISVKDCISLVNLKDVCNEWQKKGATLQDFTSTEDKHTKLVKLWLKTWCNFHNDTAMFYCLRCVEVHNLGDEDNIHEQCNTSLSNWYQDSDKVRTLITQFLVDNASENHSLTPRLIANHIQEHIKTERQKWVRYEKHGPSDWSISGILSNDVSTVEPANAVVETLWDDNANRNFELQLHRHPNVTRNCSLDLSLIRLALHAPRSVSLRHNEASSWKDNISSEINFSIGSSKDELKKLNVLDYKLNWYTSYSRSLSKRQEISEENSSLHRSMDCITWMKIKDAVDDIIASMNEGEVQDAAEDIWCNWKKTIDLDLEVQSEAMYDMLFAIVENNQQIGQLRTGLNTVNIMSEAFETLLLIAIGLGANSVNWTDFKNKFSLRVIALAVWCGAQPKGSRNRTKSFFTGDSLDVRREFLGKETSKILVLPQASSSPTEILACTLASDPSSGDSMADARTPNAVITRSMAFIDAVEENTIESLKAYVNSVINKRKEQRDEHVQLLTTG